MMFEKNPAAVALGKLSAGKPRKRSKQAQEQSRRAAKAKRPGRQIGATVNEFASLVADLDDRKRSQVLCGIVGTIKAIANDKPRKLSRELLNGFVEAVRTVGCL